MRTFPYHSFFGLLWRGFGFRNQIYTHGGEFEMNLLWNFQQISSPPGKIKTFLQPTWTKLRATDNEC